MIDSIESLDSFFNNQSPSLGNGKLRENRLERMRKILSSLGSPERGLSIYHVAGSKGKGTVSTLLSYLLKESGEECGLYLSPHVYDVRERFTSSGSFYPEELYIKVGSIIEDVARRIKFPQELGCEKATTFELYTAFAYLIFNLSSSTSAVIETGLGGRLDATNTTRPRTSILTHIETEHKEILGPDLASIAREKAGIIKKGVPVFSSYQKEEVMRIFEESARAMGSELFTLEKDVKAIKREASCHYSARILNREAKIILPYDSDTMLEDALLAALTATYFNINKSMLFSFSSFKMPGRFEKREIAYKDKRIKLMLDGAHTPDSAASLLNEIIRSGEAIPKALLFSSAEGKEIGEIAKRTFAPFDSIFVTGLGRWKRYNINTILSEIENYTTDKEVVIDENISSALFKALDRADSSLLVFGSFYLVSGVVSALKEAKLVN